jgi:hypothetical protein
VKLAACLRPAAASRRRRAGLAVAGVEYVDGGVATDLGQGGGAGGDDRQAVPHRLQDGQAEALVEARKEERLSVPVEQLELGVGDPAEDPAVR